MAENEPPPSGEALPPGVIAQAEAIASSNSNPTSLPTSGHQNPPPTMADDKQDFSAFQQRPGDSRSLAGTMGRTDYMQEPPIEDAPPPAYSESYGTLDMSENGLGTLANVASDGRVNIVINQKSKSLSNLLVPALRSQLNLQQVGEPSVPPPGYIPPSLGGLPGQTPPPPMNVVIHVVGSRGDVQPFVALGKVLKKTYGHRVRLATHPTFKGFVEENDLEFFSIGGDPAELMAFMVKNPGLMPGKDALRSGDIGKRRKGMYEIIRGCWRSCFEAGDGTGVAVSDHQNSERGSFDSAISVGGDLAGKPFVADAIIANPPSFAHIHCAEKLGIPLHLMFTMPWSPTQAFPHPLANIQSSNADVSVTNFISYALVEMMTWQGLGDVINRFRETTLGLEPVSLMWAPGMASRLRIPYTYCWSPTLIPKPKDWGSHITISGFYFLSLANTYTPDSALAEFLDSGPPPVYIGFGSIVVDDPNAMTELIFEAIKITGQRALVSKGWGGLGGDSLVIPKGVFMLGNVPHDWLFNHVSCVVHHGGAGTTAAGIATGKPTVVVPFFGDQPFWGAMVAKAGAGPLPIHNKHLTAANLAAAIMEALKPTTLQRAQELGASINSEKGSDVGAKSFHDSLDVDKLRCSLAPSRVAVWRVKRTEIRLSGFAAAVLGNEGLLDFTELKLYRSREYDSEDGPWEPISGGASALMGTIGSILMGVADFPVEIFKAFQKKNEASSKKEEDTIRPPGNVSKSSSIQIQSESSISIPRDSSSVSEDMSTPSITGGSLDTSTQPTSPMHGTSGRSSSSSSILQPNSTPKSPHESSGGHQISCETAIGAGKGVRRMLTAGLKSPMDFTLGIARGFHNAPKLYGDESVRKPDRITDLQSGLKAAGKEFGFGFYDGISGLVTQPMEGAKKEGVAGLFKGFGKGIGGVVLKPGAAIWGIPGYTFMGIYKELRKHVGDSVQNYIIAARTAQGYDDWRASSQEQRLDIVSRWHAAQVELGKQKKQWHDARSYSHHGLKKAAHPSSDGGKQTSHQKKKHRGLGLSRNSSGTSSAINNTSVLNTIPPVTTASDEEGLENAIRESVSATSSGNADEDALIERAIRASVAELRRASKEGNENDAIQRAIRASVAEANRSRAAQAAGGHSSGTLAAHDHDRELEEALRISVQEHSASVDDHLQSIHHNWDDSGIDTDDDENIKRALENSKQSTAVIQPDDNDDLQEAIHQSREYHEREIQNEHRSKTEEEIVLEYVKKQSLAEEEYRRELVAKGKAVDRSENDDDLERALSESLRVHGKVGEPS